MSKGSRSFSVSPRLPLDWQSPPEDWPKPAAFGLILVMLGAIEKKIFVWRTAFGVRDLQGGTMS